MTVSRDAVTPLATYQGGCHCGRVRFEVDLSAAPELLECNCSICSKTGYLHLIVSKAQFRVTAGGETLTSYRFNTGAAQHLFCSRCGIKSFYVPRSHPDGYSVNARCIDGFDVGASTVVPFDGRDWERAGASARDLSL